MTVLRALILGAAVAGYLVHPARAEVQNPLKADEEMRRKDDDAVDKQYKSTLKRTNKETTATRTDPWLNMRGADDSKTKR